MMRFVWSWLVAVALVALAVGCMDLDPLPDRPDASMDTDVDTDTDTDVDTDTDSDTDTDTDIHPDGYLVWAKRAGGSGWEGGDGVSALSDGSTVVVGFFGGTTTFGLGETNETALAPDSTADLFVAKYNTDGTLAWVKSPEGTGFQGGGNDAAISALSDGSVLVTWGFGGTATFGAGETNETALVSAGDTDIFVAKYNADGTLAWAKRAGGSGGDYALGVSAASDGSAMVIGDFSGTATFGAGEANETVLTSVGSGDIVIAKLVANGTLAWAKRAGGSGIESGYGISALSGGSAVVTGLYSGTVTFGAGETHETALTSAGDYDIYVARYDADGTLAWAKSAGGTEQDVGRGISFIPSDDSVLVQGKSGGTATFGAGEVNETTLASAGGLFVAKYQTDGTFVWVKNTGGDIYAWGAIATAPDGSSSVTGLFYGTVTFGDGEENETSLVCAGAGDLFVAKFNSDGTLAWAKNAGGDESYNEGHGIAALPDGSSVVTGFFRLGSPTFGAGEENETTLIPDGEADIFVAKFGP